MKKFLQTHPPITEAIRFFYTLFAQHLSTPTWVLLREVPMFLLFLKVQATKPWWVAHLLLFSSPLLGAFEVMLNLRNKKREGESFFLNVCHQSREQDGSDYFNLSFTAWKQKAETTFTTSVTFRPILRHLSFFLTLCSSPILIPHFCSFVSKKYSIQISICSKVDF
jgi:hypothetical protein